MFVPNLPTLVLCSFQIYLLFLRSNLPNYCVILVPIIVLCSSQLSCYVCPNYHATFIPTIVLHSSQLLCYCYVCPKLSCDIHFNYHATFVPIIVLQHSESTKLSCYVHSNYLAMFILAIALPTIILHSSLQ